MRETRKRAAAPTATPQNTTPTAYRPGYPLSIAGEILLLVMQTPDHADRLRHTCFNRLNRILRAYYSGGRAGA